MRLPIFASAFCLLLTIGGVASAETTTEDSETSDDREQVDDVVEESEPTNREDVLFGGLLSLSVNQLSQPTDPAGEPTLLFGSAFSGVGFGAGATFTYDLTKAGPGYITARGDFMVGYYRATGFAEHRVDDFRRELTLSTVSIRTPALIGYAIAEGNTRVYAAVGPELLLNFATASAVSQTSDVDVLPKTLETKGTTHLALTTALGFGFKSKGWLIPLELRFAWDPFVGDSTRERFPDYRSNSDTGPYEVAFDWQFFINVGAVKLF